MTLAPAILWVLCFWIIVYGVQCLCRRRKPILPLSRGRKQTVEVTVKHLHLRVKTQALNGFHDAISKMLASDDCCTMKRTLLLLYDLGSVVAVIGMVIALGLLGVMAVNLFMPVAKMENRNTLALSVKRGLDRNFADESSGSTGTFSIKPIIPGVTVPLGHLPVILLALCTCQLVHESGHAIAAAMRHIPILSSGLSVTIVFPSAFVVFPAARLGELPAVDRLRILASGCFHNFLLWCLLVLVMSARVAAIFSKLVFKDFSGVGKVVVDINSDSPLWPFVPSGTIITRLDDTVLGVVGDAPSGDLWEEFLLFPTIPVASLGWCAENILLANVSTVDECPSTDGHVCFVPTDGSPIHYDLDPIPILTGNATRCQISPDCTPSSSCIALRHDQQLVRITLMSPLSDWQEQVMLWSGPRREIWEQVEVSVLRPRTPFISGRFLRHAIDLLEYTKSINLSLYLVNMLPVPSLDGAQCLAVLLELFLTQMPGTGGLDLEAFSMNTGRRTSHRRRVRLQGIIKTVLSTSTLVLVVLCALLAAIKHALD